MVFFGVYCSICSGFINQSIKLRLIYAPVSHTRRGGRVSTVLHYSSRRYKQVIKDKDSDWDKWEFGSFTRVPLDEPRELPQWDGIVNGADGRKEEETLSAEDIAKAVATLESYVQPERLTRLRDILSKRTSFIRIVIENPSNPNNAWAALRTMDAFGIQHCHVIATPEMYPKKGRLLTMSTAMGAQKWLTLHGHESPEDAVCALRALGFHIIGADAAPTTNTDEEQCANDSHEKATTSYIPPALEVSEIDWSRPTALVLGNELRGMSPMMRSLCDATFHIPMDGFAESLNLSVACAVALASARTGGALGHIGKEDRGLPEREKAILYLRWLLRTVRAGEGLVAREGVTLPKWVKGGDEDDGGFMGFSTVGEYYMPKIEKEEG